MNGVEHDNKRNQWSCDVITPKETNQSIDQLDCMLKKFLVAHMDTDGVEERQSGQSVYPCAKNIEENIVVSLVLLLLLWLLRLLV